METDEEPSPVFSPLSVSTSFEFIALSSRSSVNNAPQPTASSDVFFQDLQHLMLKSKLSSSSSNASPLELQIRPRVSASRPESSRSQPPHRRNSSQAATPESSTDRASSIGSCSSGTSLLQATRIWTTPKLVVPKLKKLSAKDKDKKKKK